MRARGSLHNCDDLFLYSSGVSEPTFGIYATDLLMTSGIAMDGGKGLMGIILGLVWVAGGWVVGTGGRDCEMVLSIVVTVSILLLYNY